MSHPRSHHISVYSAQLHVATTPKAWARLQAKYDLADNDSPGACHLFVDTAANNTPHVAVWVDTKNLTGSELVDTIAHEAVHAAAQLLDHIGQRADRHDSEALAYLTGWVAGKIWDAT